MQDSIPFFAVGHSSGMSDRLTPWTRNHAKGNKDTSRHSLCSLVMALVPQVQAAHSFQNLRQL